MVHSDYLGTPRYIMDSSNNLLWKWENTDPYGANLAQGTLEFNLRFAGQFMIQSQDYTTICLELMILMPKDICKVTLLV